MKIPKKLHSKAKLSLILTQPIVALDSLNCAIIKVINYLLQSNLIVENFAWYRQYKVFKFKHYKVYSWRLKGYHLILCNKRIKKYSLI